VSLRIDYDERAIGQAAAFLDDPQGMRAVLDAIDRLADDPRRGGSFPYGSPDLRRLRVLVPAERDGHRCWLVGGRKPGPNRPTQPAWNWTLPGASRTVTFAER
jgi:hypothetical protein